MKPLTRDLMMARWATWNGSNFCKLMLGRFLFVAALDFLRNFCFHCHFCRNAQYSEMISYRKNRNLKSSILGGFEIRKSLWSHTKSYLIGFLGITLPKNGFTRFLVLFVFFQWLWMLLAISSQMMWVEKYNLTRMNYLVHNWLFS